MASHKLLHVLEERESLKCTQIFNYSIQKHVHEMILWISVGRCWAMCRRARMNLTITYLPVI